jgi:hypothetical protein
MATLSAPLDIILNAALSKLCTSRDIMSLSVSLRGTKVVLHGTRVVCVTIKA